MQKYDAIEQGIAGKDVGALREAIGSICYTSRNFSSGEFDEAIKYVEAHGIKLKDDALAGNPTISSQKDVFSDEDFARAVFELKRNFCDERIRDVKTIGKKLYSTSTVVPDAERSSGTGETGKTGTDPNADSRQSGKMTLIVGVAAAIVIIALFILVMK
ncbi:MAG: hypothetical protein NC432_05575 [Roseburia sp.]|nr:hypothetical protein [Roseburia sp.]MCM1096606.1 hypothetical protein [Ruminococcus flavefaciens]